jgi:hypothetical protein
MVIIYSEKVSSDFKGTIIDIESVGEFNRSFIDSREYQDLTPVIFGHLSENQMSIYCAKSPDSVLRLKNLIKDIAPKLKKPLYAFNCNFEQGVLFHSCGLQVTFDGELNEQKREGKYYAVKTLGIPNYDDPFNDSGYKCMLSWKEECVSDIERGVDRPSIRHNRSCLLKERDILLKRGYREPDPLIFHEILM